MDVGELFTDEYGRTLFYGEDGELYEYGDPDEYEWDAERLARLDRLEAAMDQAMYPPPDPAELERQIADEEAQARAEEDANWAAALAENINLVEHRLGQKLTAEERQAIFEDAAKNGHIDPVPALVNYRADLSTPEGRRELMAKVARESLPESVPTLALPPDRLESSPEEHKTEKGRREAMAKAAEESEGLEPTEDHSEVFRAAANPSGGSDA
jgi:hypothetical protein